MKSRDEIFIFSCHPQDVAILREASGPQGPVFHAVDSLVEVAHQAATRRPAAVFIGVGDDTLGHLDVIRTIHAVRNDLPVVVIGDHDSLELERRARQQIIFYYLVHPIEREEVEAVLRDVLRHAGT
mgnify:FL=1